MSMTLEEISDALEKIFTAPSLKKLQEQEKINCAIWVKKLQEKEEKEQIVEVVYPGIDPSSINNIWEDRLPSPSFDADIASLSPSTRAKLNEWLQSLEEKIAEREKIIERMAKERKAER